MVNAMRRPVAFCAGASGREPDGVTLAKQRTAVGNLINVSDRYHLLGDSAYALQLHVMVPYSDLQISRSGFLAGQRTFFNECLQAERVLSEQYFCDHKARHPLLRGEVALQPDDACKLLTASTIIHAFCEENGDHPDKAWKQEAVAAIAEERLDHEACVLDSRSRAATVKRNDLAAQVSDMRRQVYGGD